MHAQPCAGQGSGVQAILHSSSPVQHHLVPWPATWLRRGCLPERPRQRRPGRSVRHACRAGHPQRAPADEGPAGARQRCSDPGATRLPLYAIQVGPSLHTDSLVGVARMGPSVRLERAQAGAEQIAWGPTSGARAGGVRRTPERAAAAPGGACAGGAHRRPERAAAVPGGRSAAQETARPRHLKLCAGGPARAGLLPASASPASLTPLCGRRHEAHS